MIELPILGFILAALLMIVVGFFLGVWMGGQSVQDQIDYNENMVEVYKQRYLALEKEVTFKPRELEHDILDHFRSYEEGPPHEGHCEFARRTGIQAGLKMALVMLRGRL